MALKRKFAGRVRIRGLAQDIAVPVIGVDPGGTGSADSSIIEIIDPNELSQCVILVGELGIGVVVVGNGTSLVNSIQEANGLICHLPRRNNRFSYKFNV